MPPRRAAATPGTRHPRHARATVRGERHGGARQGWPSAAGRAPDPAGQPDGDGLARTGPRGAGRRTVREGPEVVVVAVLIGFRDLVRIVRVAAWTSTTSTRSWRASRVVPQRAALCRLGGRTTFAIGAAVRRRGGATTTWAAAAGESTAPRPRRTAPGCRRGAAAHRAGRAYLREDGAPAAAARRAHVSPRWPDAGTRARRSAPDRCQPLHAARAHVPAARPGPHRCGAPRSAPFHLGGRSSLACRSGGDRPIPPRHRAEITRLRDTDRARFAVAWAFACSPSSASRPDGPSALLISAQTCDPADGLSPRHCGRSRVRARGQCSATGEIA